MSALGQRPTYRDQDNLLFAFGRRARIELSPPTGQLVLMTTDETGFPEHISELAREHGRAAITVLAEIMTQEDAPAGVRVTAAKALHGARRITPPWPPTALTPCV